jgi:hypothetical protein
MYLLPLLMHSYLIFTLVLAQQGVRKVLDVKFHPEGLPQLVSSSNEVSAIYDSFCILYSRIVEWGPSNGCVVVAASFPVGIDGNKSLYLVFVGVVFFSASWTAFRAVRTAS